MKSIISPAGTFGGFTSVTELSDRYVTDSCEYPFSAIGSPHSIGDWAAPIVVPIKVVTTPVSPRQIRMAMTRTPYKTTTLRVAVEAAVTSSDQDTKDWYNDSNYFDRYNSISIALGTSLGLTPDDLDNLWNLANTL